MAEGEKQSAILKADAAKQARIMAAEAEATSIMKVQQALADAMRMLNENAPNDQVIKLKSLEALQKMADARPPRSSSQRDPGAGGPGGQRQDAAGERSSPGVKIFRENLRLLQLHL